MREQIPQRRQQVVMNVEFKGGRYTLAVGFYPDGRPAEVFIDSHKRTSDADIIARDVATIISLGVQYGVPIAVMRGAVGRDDQGEPAGIAGVALDTMASIEFRPPFVVMPIPLDMHDAGNAGSDARPVGPADIARMKGYTGDACTDCGNHTMVRNGVCLKCDTCGSTTGCS